jgi:hypothetical protein
MPISTSINAQLHLLLAQTKLLPQKANLVESFTNGRSGSTKDLHFIEATEMLTYLRTEFAKQNKADTTKKKDDDQANKLRRKLIALAWQMNWTTTKVNANGSTHTACDMPRVNGWCNTYGYLHKPLNDYKVDELPKLLTQFEKAYNDYIKAV